MDPSYHHLSTLFFLFRDGHRIAALLVELAPLRPANTRRILVRLGQTVEAVFVGALGLLLTAALVEGIALYRKGREQRDLASAAVTSGSDPATPPG